MTALSRLAFVFIAAALACLFALSRCEPVQAQSGPSLTRLDLLWQHDTNGSLSTWEMNGTTQLTGLVLSPSPLSDPGWRMVGSGDFDGDGQPDVVWHHQTTGAVSVWLMEGTALRPGGGMSLGSPVTDLNWKLGTVGDLNNDGKPDLIWQHQTQGWVSAWLMNGTQMIEGTLLTPAQVADVDWKIVGMGDTNADGKNDLFWQHQSQGYLSTWRMNGLQQINGVSLNPSAVDINWKIRATGDVNQDGHVDLIWQRLSTRDLSAWFMSGINQQSYSSLSPTTAPSGWTITSAFRRPVVAAPTLSAASGTYSSELSLNASSATAGATIRYTTNGTDPTAGSAILQNVSLSNPTTVRARAFKNGMVPSSVVSETYGFKVSLPNPSVASGAYLDTFTVALSTGTSNSTVRYTTDGTAPTELSTPYTAALSVNQSTTIRARAFRQGWTSSDEAVLAYELRVRPPAFTPPTGHYEIGEQITLASDTVGATIRYTLDGTQPTETSQVYSGSLVPTSAITHITARAYRSGWTSSPAVSSFYTTFHALNGEDGGGEGTPGQEGCVKCEAGGRQPLQGRGTHTDGRRIISVNIDSSWDVVEGHTNTQIWNAVRDAVAHINDKTDSWGNKNGYFLVVDQTFAYGYPATMTIKKTTNPCNKGIDGIGCSVWPNATDGTIELSSKLTAFWATDFDRRGVVAHEIAHGFGVNNTDGGPGCSSIINPGKRFVVKNSLGTAIREESHVTTFGVQSSDITAMNVFLNTPNQCTGTLAAQSIEFEDAGEVSEQATGTADLYYTDPNYFCWQIWNVTYYQYYDEETESWRTYDMTYDQLMSAACFPMF